MMPDETPTNPTRNAPRVSDGRERFVMPSQLLVEEERSQKLLLLAIRMMFMVLLLTIALLPFVGQLTQSEQDDPLRQGVSYYVGPFVAMFALGLIVLLVDIATPNKRLSSVFGVYLGIVAGLVGALAVGALIDLVAESWDISRSSTARAYLLLAKLAIGITLCYLAVTIVLTTKDDLRLVIPYVEFAKQLRGVRPLVLDTSVLIDGRLNGLGQTGFLDAPLIIPGFVIDELQKLADSGDKLKRERGRRGLEVTQSLQASPYLDVSIDDTEIPGHSVDAKLIRMAQEQSVRILTTDYNLNQVAEIQGVTALNLNDLSNTLKSQAIPGETLMVEIIKHGEGQNQGVGYMPDGTMVVVEEAGNRVGEPVTLLVTNSLQTSAGRMIFGKMLADRTDGEDSARMADAATSQPRTPPRSGTGTAQRSNPTGRNPRR